MSDRRKRGRRDVLTLEERVVRLYGEVQNRRRIGQVIRGKQIETTHMVIAQRLKIPCQQVRQILTDRIGHYEITHKPPEYRLHAIWQREWDW